MSVVACSRELYTVDIYSRGCGSGNKFEGLWKRQQKRKKVGTVGRTWNVKEVTKEERKTQ